MNQIRICTVVTGATFAEFLENLKKMQEVSELLELRVDFISDIKPDDVKRIRDETHKPAIFTCRSKDEGGKFEKSEDDRLAIIRQGIDLGFEYVDVEYETLKKNRIDKKNSKLIASYHNFEETPPYWKLTKLVFDMQSVHADVIKIATFVTKEYDVQVLFRVLLSKKPDENQIIIGMGEKGRLTRILGPLLGSYLTFARTPFTQSAPGQIEINELKQIYKSMFIIV